MQTVKKVFPEETLYGINGQIVELKSIQPREHHNIADEAAEALMQATEEELEREQEDVAHVKKLTYNEIGFGPAKGAFN